MDTVGLTVGVWVTAVVRVEAPVLEKVVDREKVAEAVAVVLSVDEGVGVPLRDQVGVAVHVYVMDAVGV